MKKYMSIEEMKNEIARLYGLEARETVIFFCECACPNNNEIKLRRYYDELIEEYEEMQKAGESQFFFIRYMHKYAECAGRVRSRRNFAIF